MPWAGHPLVKSGSALSSLHVWGSVRLFRQPEWSGRVKLSATATGGDTVEFCELRCHLHCNYANRNNHSANTFGVPRHKLYVRKLVRSKKYSRCSRIRLRGYKLVFTSFHGQTCRLFLQHCPSRSFSKSSKGP